MLNIHTNKKQQITQQKIGEKMGSTCHKQTKTVPQPHECENCLPFFDLRRSTPPKFNIDPEKWWLEDYFPFGKVYFRELC